MGSSPTKLIPPAAVMIKLVVALGSAAACAGGDEPYARMPDGRVWTTRNLAVSIDGSYCYDEKETAIVRPPLHVGGGTAWLP